jgi:hypothetical protein
MDRLKFRFVFLLLISSAILAQPAIDISITDIFTDTLSPGGSHSLCYPGPPVIIRNTGTVPLQLGLSGDASNWHLDTIGGYGDTVRLWGEISDSVIPSYDFYTLTNYTVSFLQRYSPSYFGTDGAFFNPGDSLFLHLRIGAPCCPWPRTIDTLSLFVHGRRGPVTVTKEISIRAIVLGWDSSPPDSIVIDSVFSTPGSERVVIITERYPWMYCADYYNVYRDTLPFFYMSQCINVPTMPGFNLLPEHASRYFSDNFADTLWHHYFGGSKGIGDTLVNLFYVYTTVDTGVSTPVGYSETYYPSNLLCEYDQPLHTSPVLGSCNWVSIPNENQYKRCSDLSPFGIKRVDEWNAASQVSSTIGLKIGSSWVINGKLKVSHVYRFWCSP